MTLGSHQLGHRYTLCSDAEVFIAKLFDGLVLRRGGSARTDVAKDEFWAHRAMHINLTGQRELLKQKAHQAKTQFSDTSMSSAKRRLDDKWSRTAHLLILAAPSLERFSDVPITRAVAKVAVEDIRANVAAVNGVLSHSIGEDTNAVFDFRSADLGRCCKDSDNPMIECGRLGEASGRPVAALRDVGWDDQFAAQVAA